MEIEKEHNAPEEVSSWDNPVFRWGPKSEVVLCLRRQRRAGKFSAEKSFDFC